MAETKETDDSGVKVIDDQRGRGKGLVAARNFSRDELICRYSPKFVPLKEIKDETTETFKHRFDVADGVYFLDKECAGQYANDAVHPDVIKQLYACRSLDDVNNWTTVYFASSLVLIKRNIINARFYDEREGNKRRLYVQATCDIKAGSDIFVNYGSDYWTGVLSLDEKADPIARATAVCWVASKGVFPNLGVINKLPAILLFVTGDDGQPAMAMVGPVTSSLDSVGKCVDSLEGASELCARWLKALGFPKEDGDALAIWYNLCVKIGTPGVTQAAVKSSPHVQAVG
ncbi:MAG: SET domain-containing protein [Patescibacteria group bacterium]|nr:SET domain-containing protein [Patescibacteria group bacterium]